MLFRSYPDEQALLKLHDRLPPALQRDMLAVLKMGNQGTCAELFQASGVRFWRKVAAWQQRNIDAENSEEDQRACTPQPAACVIPFPTQRFARRFGESDWEFRMRWYTANIERFSTENIFS